MVERSRGPSTRPTDSEVYTYRTWWHSRSPAAVSAMAFRQIGQVWAPILLVQGTGDEVVQFEEAVALAGWRGGRQPRRHGDPHRRGAAQLRGPRDRDAARGHLLAARAGLMSPRVVNRGGRTAPPLFGADDRDLAIDLVVTHTEDDQKWDGMIFKPRRRRRSAPPRLAVLVVHGSVGNYLTGVPRRVSFGLAKAGFTVLSVNTRMANYGVIFGGGLMHRTPLDIDAALAVLRRRGFRRIVLLGFSMGSTIVTHYQALRQPPDVVGVCTLAHPASLPAALRLRWDYFGADPGYEEVVELVHRRLAPDFEDSGPRSHLPGAPRPRLRRPAARRRDLDLPHLVVRPRAARAARRVAASGGSRHGAAGDRPGGRGRAGARGGGHRARGHRAPGRLSRACCARRSRTPTTSSRVSTSRWSRRSSPGSTAGSRRGRARRSPSA